MANIFNSIFVKKPKKNAFNLSHEHKFSTNFGKLTPFLCLETLPGETYSLNTASVIRTMPLIAPLMHNVKVNVHYFFVPNRILWSQWEDFIGGGKDGTTDILPLQLRFDQDGIEDFFGVGSLADYLGCPVFGADERTPHNDIFVNALPFLAYQKIWQDYFQDENYQSDNNIEFPITDSGDLELEQACKLHNRCFAKDYFTSALPNAQRGPEVSLPISGDANVYYDTNSPNYQELINVQDDTHLKLGNSITVRSSSFQPNHYGMQALNENSSGRPVNIDPNGTLKADLSQVNAATINDLRKAMSLQKWFEINARAGYRAVEQLFAHFGVKPKDSRLDRAEFIGGDKNALFVTPVVQQSSTDATSPQGNITGNGYGSAVGNSFKYTTPEHGFIIGIMSVLPDSNYMQGMPKMFTRKDRFDYYFPEFANLGEQEVKSGEVYFESSEDDDLTFGYTPRFAEYRYQPSRVSGDFRNTLDGWHLARIFNSRPMLNSAFLTVNPQDFERAFALEDGSDKLQVDALCVVKKISPMPKYAIPKL